MADRILVPIRKFDRLLDYMERVGLDADAMAASARLSRKKLRSMPAGESLPGSDYSCMYREAVRQWQSLKRPIPWAAGMGSEAFELMCHCIIGAKNLGAALSLAQRFDSLIYPMVGYRVSITADYDFFKLAYHVRKQPEDSVFIPEDWEWAKHNQTVSQASGLTLWYSLCGWLIGRSIDVEAVHVAGAPVSESYDKSLSNIFQCPIHFEGSESYLQISTDFLAHRLVQNSQTLEDFLLNAVHELISINSKPTSTAAAIRSLIRLEFQSGMPSFEKIAEMLHMSESSLRRRLVKEETSYQRLKDEVRCEIAVEYLREDKMKINDISEILGFTEPSSFVRSFRGWMGMTPKAYRDSQAASA